MARSYDRPPGVTITEVTQASINPLIATPDQLALIGPSTGAITVEESVILTTGVTPTELKGIDKDDQNFTVVSVTDYDSASAQASNGGYTSKSGYIPGSYTTAGGSGSAYTIARKEVLTTAQLKTGIAATGSITEIEAIGDAGFFNGYNTIVIDSEQFTYTGIATGANEKQKVLIADDDGSDAFTLTFSGQTTTSLARNASAATVQTALVALSNIEPGDVTVTDVGEVQKVTIVNGSSGDTFDLTVGANTFATPVAHDVSAAALQTALEGLASVGSGNVDVTKSGAEYTIQFKGAKINENMPAITGTGTGCTVTVDQVSNHGYEVEFKGQFANEDVALLTGTGTGCTVAVTVSQTSYFKFTGVTRAANNTSEAQHTTDVGTNPQTFKIKLGFVIPENRTVYVKYTYTPKDYFYPYVATASEFSNIERRFGNAFKDDGLTINSPLTLAAKIAIENGANDLILQPIFYSGDSITGDMPNRTQPTSALSFNTSNVWNKSLRALQNEENVRIIVPVIGQTENYTLGSDGQTSPVTVLNNAAQLGILTSLQQHISYMDTEYDQLIIGIVGEDSTNASATNATVYPSRTVLSNHLVTLQQYAFAGKNYNERLIFIAQTDFRRPSTQSATQEIKLGGQYAAAAVAGKLVSYSPQVSLTRKTLGGFQSVVDTRTKKNKTDDSKAGFFVIEQNPIDSTIIVRHALTTDTTSVAKSEVNAIRAKHFMINSLRRTIDTQVIGQVIADDTAPITITSVVASTLRTLQDDGVIVQFDSVQSQIDSIDPTQIGVRFNYRPAFAINYVNIRFSVDLTSGITNLSTTDQANIGA